MENVVLDNLLGRRSVRSYNGKPVEKEKVELLLRAAMAAPSALNRQPWHFIVVDKRELLDKIAELTPNAHAAATAPLAIVLCGNMQKAIEGEGKDYWMQDLSAATENILLAAEALNLGSLWTGICPIKERCATISRLFQLPEHIVPFATIIIGYEEGVTKPKDKFKEENISYNGY